MRGRRSLPALVTVALLLAGCGTPSPSNSAVPIPSPALTPSPAASSSVSASASSMASATPTPETPSATTAPLPPPTPAVVRPVSTSAVPIRDTAFRMGRGIRMAPQGDGGLYVAIPDGEDTLLVALDDKLRVRPGWPLLVKGRYCDVTAEVGDGSVRAVCGADLLGFDRNGRPLGGWPVRLPQGVYPRADPRVIGGDLYLVAETYDEARSSATAWIVRVSRDGTVETGTAVATDPAEQASTVDITTNLGPDGTGYILDYVEPQPATLPPHATIRAFDLEGLRPGWPIQFDPPSVSSPGFGRDGQVYLVQGVDDGASRLRSVDRQGRTLWTAELPVSVSPDWSGAAAFDVPAPPATGSQGPAFVVTEPGPDKRSVVYAVDPSGEVTGRWETHVGLAWAGFCGLQSASGAGCSTGCGQVRVVPVVGDDGTLYIAQEDGSVTAVGPDGRTQGGWPVTLRRPGAAFWSLATDADATVFALAIEWEPGATPECGYPPASATILAIDPDGSVRARVTVAEP